MVTEAIAVLPAPRQPPSAPPLPAPAPAQQPRPDIAAGAAPSTGRPTGEPPNGGAAAAVLAGGVGCAAFGVAVVLSESVPAVASAFTLSTAVGPLSGKAVAGVVGYLVAWLILHAVMRRREVDLSGVLRWTCVLVGLGLIATFPPVYDLIAGN